MKPTPKAIAEARKHPNGHVFIIKGHYGPNAAIPPHAIKGAWKVDANGNICGDFIPNPMRNRGLFRRVLLRIVAMKETVTGLVLMFVATSESSLPLMCLAALVAAIGAIHAFQANCEA
jgi:hypothetical protein